MIARFNGASHSAYRLSKIEGAVAFSISAYPRIASSRSSGSLSSDSNAAVTSSFCCINRDRKAD